MNIFFERLSLPPSRVACFYVTNILHSTLESHMHLKLRLKVYIQGDNFDNSEWLWRFVAVYLPLHQHMIGDSYDLLASKSLVSNRAPAITVIQWRSTVHFLGFWKFTEMTDESWVTLLVESCLVNFPEWPWEPPLAIWHQWEVDWACNSHPGEHLNCSHTESEKCHKIFPI